MATAQVTPTQPTVVAGQSSALTPHTVLVCQNLEKYYGTRGNITKALDGINRYHGSFWFWQNYTFKLHLYH